MMGMAKGETATFLSSALLLWLLILDFCDMSISKPT